ncbi:hypothetical protein [Streptomyces sp. NRRL F-5123]|uniref:hypothetical protein n=1 Tax=Streptomyces sp. NRRL F-5123 TaxID=1463856 RepID=UPI00099BF64C|nr:hypothetical protein [Streptomyces sp. NRRL F-5123]
MLLNPKYPPAPTAPAAPVSTSTALPQHAHAPVCACQQAHPAATPGHRFAPTVGVVAGAVAAVVTVGVILTALLVAVTVAAISVAIVAVILRSLLAPPRQR